MTNSIQTSAREEPPVNAIVVEGLRKRFDALTAVDGISFQVRAGEIFGFLGPNGAGKSTTISMLATLLHPTEGTAAINGYDILNQRDLVRQSLGLVFQDPTLDDRLTAEENLRFHARLYGVIGDRYHKRIREVLELVDLWDRRDNIVRTFSGGMKRRLEIARGLIHYPRVLFLDEPTLGLDPQTRVHIWEYIRRLQQNQSMTIFLTTHYMQEAENCDRVAVIDHGQIIANDTPAALKKQVGEDIITIQSRDKDALKHAIEERYQFRVQEENGSLRLGVPDGDHLLPKLLRDLPVEIDSIQLAKPTLEDVFIHLTGRRSREETVDAKKRWQQRVRRRRQ